MHEVFGIHSCMAEGQEAVSGRGRARAVQVSFLWEMDPSVSMWELFMEWFCLVCNRYCLKQDFFYGTKQARRGLTQCLSGCGMMYLCLTITPVKSSNALRRKSPNLTSARSHAIQILHSPTSQSFCAALSVQLHAKYLSVNMLDPLNLYDML